MIEAKKLRKIYRTKKGVVVRALDGVSLKLPETGMVFILGKSGSGKSTLLNVLGGLDNFDSGEIIIKGTSAKDFKQSHYDSYRNTYIGFIFQEYNILEELTVGANIALAIELQGRKATNNEINEILKEVDLEGYGSRKPNELSGGQKQRVAIARALVKRPEIIMADEPTGALDSTTGKQVFDTLKKLSRDKLVLIVSHDREFSEQYADRIIELADGRIISDVEKKTESGQEDSIDIEQPITFEDNEIKIEHGYYLTEEDRLQINKYLSGLSCGASIKVGKKEKNKFTSKDFVPTDESKIVPPKNDKFELIKSRLSIKNAFKIGSGALKYKKIRLVFTIFLSLIAFTFFGLADTIAAYDNIKTATSSIYDTGVDYASYIKSYKRYYDDESFYWVDYDTYLSEEDIKAISDNVGEEVVGVYNKELKLSISDNLAALNDGNEVYEALYPTDLTGITSISEELMSRYGFTFVGQDSRLAQEKNEVVITKFVYDYFQKVGYKCFSDKGFEEIKIEKPEDLLGKKLSFKLNPTVSYTEEYTIVGIIDTNFDYSRYIPLTDENATITMNLIEYMSLVSELEAASRYSFACVAFVSDDALKSAINAYGGMAERFEGNITLFGLENDNIEYEYDIWENEMKIYFQEGFSRISSLSKLKDKVIWSTGELEALDENQIIVPPQVLLYMLRSSSGDESILWDESRLVGFEKTLLQNVRDGKWNVNYGVCLNDILRNMQYFSCYKYAYENYDEVKALVLQYCIDVYGMNAEDAEKISESDVYTTFVNTQFTNYSNIVTDDYVKEYRNALAKTYGIENMLISDEIASSLITTVTYDDITYSSYYRDEMSTIVSVVDAFYDIVVRKYVYDNYDDAFAYCKAATGEEEIPFDFAIDTYIQYLTGYKSENVDFTPSAEIGFEEYYARKVLDFYNLCADSMVVKNVISYYSYYSYNEGLIKNIEIVGVVPNDSNENFIIMDDEIVNSLLGVNVGGIYSFAVGRMPSDMQGIRTHVAFSNEYIKDDVRYKLKNNVTQQLDMVDELLDVLGDVFLYIGIGVAVFASMMLFNFIATSVSYKKQEIGILRAIGSRSSDVFGIFFAEAFIIAMINYVLSIAGTLTVTLIINSVLREEAGLLITFLNFGLRQIVLLLLISLFVAFISTFIPVKKIASMKPIDAIKNRK